MFNTTCKSKFYELLKLDKCMIYYYYLDNLRNIVIPSSLKPCEGLENSTTYYVDKIIISMIKDDSNIAKRANEIMTNEATSLNLIIITNRKLESSGIKMHNIICKKKLTSRKEKQG